MKILYFVRHGKAFPRTGKPDIQRALSDIGQHEVEAIAKRLRQEPMKIDAILCSPAERARQTAEILVVSLGYDPTQILIHPTMYEGECGQLIDAIQNLDNAYTTVMLIGHNPALSETAHRLVHNFDSQIRTSGVLGAHFTCETWQEVPQESGHLFLYDFPVRLAPKVQKHAQAAIHEDIMATLGAILDPIDHQLPGSLRKTIAKTSQRLAKDVLHVLHTSRLDSLLDQEDVISGRDGSDHTPA